MSGGTIKGGNVQIGQDGTATNNFTWYQPAVADGSVRLGQGVAGATTKDMITVSGSNITLGGNLVQAATAAPAFSAYLNTSNQSLSLATWTKIQMGTEEFDTASCYDTTLYRFTPNVAGYYQINALLNFDWSGSQFSDAQVAIYKNGSAAKRGVQSSYGGYGMGAISVLIYMNGTTDYLEVYAYIAGGSGPQIYGGSTSSQIVTWSGSLARSA